MKLSTAIRLPAQPKIREPSLRTIRFISVAWAEGTMVDVRDLLGFTWHSALPSGLLQPGKSPHRASN
jgi:hypothetical protein